MIENFALEMDFLPVGTGSKSGDAIALRFGIVEYGKWKTQTVFVIDGGDTAAGTALVDHIMQVYETDVVDRVILTHPDGDHASGLRQVLDNLEVGKLWMHRPWNHWKELRSSILDGRITERSFGERLRASYQYAHELEQMAIRKGIPIFAPHQGNYYQSNDEFIFTILGPGKELYLSLVQTSEKNPYLESVYSTPVRANGKTKRVFENMSFETEHLIDQDGSTSPENDMSLVMLLTVGRTRFLFTGDAGTMGLYNAIRFAISNDINLRNLNGFQVPHHGSRRNISKGILKYINAKFAIISCAANSDKHPSKIVVNSLWRRNIIPFCTKGDSIIYRDPPDLPRAGYGTIQPLPFSNYVEIPDE